MSDKLNRRELIRAGAAAGLARGEHAGVSMYPYKYAVCGENGPRTLPTEALFEGEP
jgi:hypothetical protein